MSKQKLIIYRYERKPQPDHTRQSMATIDIFQATTIKMLYENYGRVSVKDITKAAGKRKSIYYFHFKDIRDAMEQLDEAVIGELRNYLRGRRFRGTANEINRAVFMIVFDIMNQRSEVFYQLCLHDRQPELIFKILQILYWHIRFPNDLQMEKPYTSDLHAEIFLCDLVCVFRKWGKETRCDINRTEPYMKELFALTAEAARKLR